MRGHGRSSKSTDFSIESLLKDTEKVLESLLPVGGNENIDVFLIGHSLGAAILAALPHHFINLMVKYSGLVMIDIIEGTNNITKIISYL